MKVTTFPLSPVNVTYMFYVMVPIFLHKGIIAKVNGRCKLAVDRYIDFQFEKQIILIIYLILQDLNFLCFLSLNYE